MKTNNAWLFLTILGLMMTALSSKAQTSQVVYNNPEHTSGSLTLSASDCNFEGWGYQWQIVVPVNTPVKVTTQLNYVAYLDAFSSVQGNVQDVFLGEDPGTETVTILSLNGIINVYCSDNYGIIPSSDVFSITFEVDDDIFSSTTDLHVPGKLSTGSDLNVGGKTIMMGNLDVFGNSRINNNLAVGTSPLSYYKAYIYNNNQSAYGIRQYSSKNSSSTLYGLYSTASNNAGDVYGIYSVVSGGTGKKWAGYFSGGDFGVYNGNMGVGVSEPLGILHVRGVYDNSWIYFCSNAGMSTTKYKPRVNYGLAFTWNYSGSEAESIINYSGESSSSRLDFTSFDGTNLTTEMTLKRGYLGLGTKSPPEKLTIAGGHADTRIRLQSTGNGSDQPANLSLWASEPGWTYFGTGIGYNVNGSPSGGRIDESRSSSYVRFLPGETKFMFQKATGVDVDAITINEEGRVGIGTASPDELLTVNGIIHAKEIKIDLQGSLADYVFHPDYQLMPLNDVEQFVKSNHHLPDIPSAQEVKENGLSMGEMQNKMLQKIEELTLYMIGQQKIISEQSAKIKELEEKIK